MSGLVAGGTNSWESWLERGHLEEELWFGDTVRILGGTVECGNSRIVLFQALLGQLSHPDATDGVPLFNGVGHDAENIQYSTVQEDKNTFPPLILTFVTE